MITKPSPPGRWNARPSARWNSSVSTPTATSSTAASTHENAAQPVSDADTGTRTLAVTTVSWYQGRNRARNSPIAGAGGEPLLVGQAAPGPGDRPAAEPGRALPVRAVAGHVSIVGAPAPPGRLSRSGCPRPRPAPPRRRSARSRYQSISARIASSSSRSASASRRCELLGHQLATESEQPGEQLELPRGGARRPLATGGLPAGRRHPARARRSAPPRPAAPRPRPRPPAPARRAGPRVRLSAQRSSPPAPHRRTARRPAASPPAAAAA